MNKTVELLAPAGSFAALEAAVNAGADAVYMGGKAFGARAYADNFGDEELEKAVRFAHLHQVRIFITVNTLVDDSETEDLAQYLCLLYNIGVDGIIVQDLGVINLARKLVPGLPLHASTQMTITNSDGVAFAAANGMERAVLARELSLKDIEQICQGTETEIEVFIHGALCVCYSGQCLMSSLIGGRSGNRGRCAQPCRLPYQLVDEHKKPVLDNQAVGQYLLSPKDLNTLLMLPKLIKAGVTSYKIEGRMKRPEYVAVVVDAYRRAIDGYKTGKFAVPPEDLLNIEQIFNRDFTTAYLVDRPGKELISDRRPNNRGVQIGRVAKLDYGSNQATLKLERELHVGDGLEFWVTVGGRVGSVVQKILVDRQEVAAAQPGEQAVITVPKGVRLNDRVFRTLDNRLMAYAAGFYGEKNKKRIPVSALVEAKLGQPLTLVLQDRDGRSGSASTDFIVETARKHPLTEATLRKQLERMGTTEYQLEALVLTCSDNVMVPMSELNEVRRKACEALDEARLTAFGPVRQPVSSSGTVVLPAANSANRKCAPKAAQLQVWVDTVEKAQAAWRAGADVVLFGGERFQSKDCSWRDYEAVAAWAQQHGKRFAFSTPRIVLEGQLPYFQKFYDKAANLKPECLYINNNSLWQLAQKQQVGIPLWADNGLNIYNSLCLNFWQQQGAAGATLSLELNLAQIEHLAGQASLPLECVVQGPVEMMISEYCVPGSFLGGLHEHKACSFKCGEQLYLQDRKDALFPLVGDQFCRMHVLNSQDLSVLAQVRQLQDCGVQKLRIDGRSYDEAKLEKITRAYAEVLKAGVTVEENWPGTTRGHYFRGVL